MNFVNSIDFTLININEVISRNHIILDYIVHNERIDNDTSINLRNVLE